MSGGLIHLACVTIAAADPGQSAPTPLVPDPLPPTPPVIAEARLSGGAAPGEAPAGALIRLVERDDLPLVRVELSFETGALVAAGRLGRAPLDALDATWIAGANGLTRGAWVEAVEARGGLADAGCGALRCWFTLTSPTEALPDLLAALGELVRAPALPRDVLRRWRPEAVSAWRTGCQSRAVVEDHAVARVLWPEGHPYRDDRTFRDLAVGRAEVRETWRTVVTEAAPMLAVVGDVTLDEIRPQLEAHFGWLRGAAEGPTSALDPPPGRVLVVDDPGSGPARITVAWASPWSRGPDHAAWQLVADVLVDGFTSRLNTRLRERDGLTYSVDGSYSDQSGAGWTRVELVVAPEEVGRAVVALDEELERMRQVGPDADELAGALRARWAWGSRQFESLSDTAWTLWVERHLGFPPGDTVRRLAAYQDVSLAAARAAAARWLAAPRLVVITGERETMDPSLASAGIRVTHRWSSGDAVTGGPLGECPGAD